ncbi:MAG TPA: PqiC family protein [Steroidobacteraceae bacterium]|nr:PqiC family protein [Steroidobacteraceae bacterium]
MKLLNAGLCALVLLTGCVTRQRDHFYVLEAQPAGSRESRSQFDRQVTLRVTVPSLVDRAEMVLASPAGVAVMDHERWAAPLADLITAALARDIEQRRNDVVVLSKTAEHAGIPLVRMTVDVDQITARLGNQLIVETHWRVTDVHTGREVLGRDTFLSPQAPQSYADVAAALSACIASLADRLAGQIPAG